MAPMIPANADLNETAIIGITVDSYAEKYCAENGLPYIYTDTNSWLNN